MSMPDISQPNIEPIDAQRGRPQEDPETTPEYPVREYIAAMSREMAQMARWDGDEALAILLEVAELRARTAGQAAP